MQQTLQYEFEINIHRIYVDISFPCNLQVRWKKGKNQSSGKFFKITEPVQFIDVNDFIGIKVKCKLVDNHFLPLETKAQVLLFPFQSNEIKVAGEIQKFDLTEMIQVDRRRLNTKKQFQLPLSRSTANSRIKFTINVKYLRDRQSEESLGDISFQAQNNTNFAQSSTDMTFRPPSDNRRSSRQKEELESKSPLMPPKPEIRNENRQERAYSRQNRSDNGRQNKDQNRVQNKKIESRNQHPFSKVDMPLGFSFGPQAISQDREKQMKELLQSFNEVNRQLIQKKKQCERLQTALRDKQIERGMDDKKMQLINELNSAITQVDALKRQKSQFVIQISRYKEDIKELQAVLARVKDDNKDLISNFNRLREETSHQNGEISKQLQKKQKQFDQIRIKFEKLFRQNQELKNDIFRKQSELISSENQAEEIKAQYLNKSVPIMEQLKRVNQDLGKQRVELQRALSDANGQLNKERNLRQEYQKRARTAIQELQKQREKIKNLVVVFEAKEKSNKESLSAIQEQMQHFFMEKDQQLKKKNSQIEQLLKRLTEETKRRQDEFKKREQESKRNELINKDCEGNQILISELRVRIKHLQQACQNLEKDYSEKEKEVLQKEELIEKARLYVTKIEHENEQKIIAIKERDDFIERAKTFMTAREKQLIAQIERIKNETVIGGKDQIVKLKGEINNLIAQGSKREAFVAELVEEGNHMQQRIQEAESQRDQAQRRIDELQEYAGHLQERLQLMQEQMEQLGRKTRSQQETLSELVKNKLQMEIQLNLCNFELKNRRNRQ